MAREPAEDPRRLTPKALAGIERAADDYREPMRDPRRQVRRLLDHIDVLTEQLQQEKRG